MGVTPPEQPEAAPLSERDASATTSSSSTAATITTDTTTQPGQASAPTPGRSCPLIVCHNCNTPGHPMPRCPQPPACWACGHTGHAAAACQTAAVDARCLSCRAAGAAHGARDCPAKRCGVCAAADHLSMHCSWRHICDDEDGACRVCRAAQGK